MNYTFNCPNCTVCAESQNKPTVYKDKERIEKNSLSSKLYGDVEAVASNPQADTMVNNINVNSPAGVFTLQTEFSQLWQFQALYPANERI